MGETAVSPHAEENSAQGGKGPFHFFNLAPGRSRATVSVRKPHLSFKQKRGMPSTSKGKDVQIRALEVEGIGSSKPKFRRQRKKWGQEKGTQHPLGERADQPRRSHMSASSVKKKRFLRRSGAGGGPPWGGGPMTRSCDAGGVGLNGKLTSDCQRQKKRSTRRGWLQR